MKSEKVTCSVCGQKSKFPVLKKDYCIEVEHYARYCPEAATLADKEVHGVIQHCPNCGYVFLRIDEKTNTKKELVQSEEYSHPFGEEYDGPKEAAECFQLAVSYQNMDCKRFAAQWYIYAGILLENKDTKARNLCYRNALFLLEQELINADVQKDIEIYLAYMNVLRMLGLVDVVQEFGSHIIKQCEGVNKRLVKTIMRQAKLNNTDYMTYVDMLFMELYTTYGKGEKYESENEMC